MRRSGRPNVVAWLSGTALRPLAAVEPPAFLFCALRLAMPFARLPDHGQPTTRPAHESNHHFRVISHGLLSCLSCGLWSVVSFATLAANRRGARGRVDRDARNGNSPILPNGGWLLVMQHNGGLPSCIQKIIPRNFGKGSGHYSRPRFDS